MENLTTDYIEKSEFLSERMNTALNIIQELRDLKLDKSLNLKKLNDNLQQIVVQYHQHQNSVISHVIEKLPELADLISDETLKGRYFAHNSSIKIYDFDVPNSTKRNFICLILNFKQQVRMYFAYDYKEDKLFTLKFRNRLLIYSGELDDTKKDFLNQIKKNIQGSINCSYHKKSY